MNNGKRPTQPINNLELQNQEVEQEQEDLVPSKFIVKRTEGSDIFYFMEPIVKNKESSKLTLEYNSFFNLEDIEYAYENSLFSITIIDQEENKSIVGIFIFNNTPFSPIKVDLDNSDQPKSPGLWEEWFEENFEKSKVNAKNSLWLIYFCLDPKYAVGDFELLRQIFHKIHLSLYTTLSTNDSILVLLSKAQYAEIEGFNPSEQQDGPVAINTIQEMIKYIYNPVRELSDEEKKKNSSSASPNQTQAVVLINKRDSVFPLIEIRIGVEYDHDDLETIFKKQTSPEITVQFEDFFIAKMIANQDDTNKVLVGQVTEKAIGVLGISTDINVNFLIKNFELENYDNLLKQGYMKGINYKRKLIYSQKELAKSEETKEIEKAYIQEIMKCERIPQRLYLQIYIIERAEYIGMINDIEKIYTSKEELTTQTAVKLITELLKEYSIIYPDLEKFEGKLKVLEGECLLSDTFNFFIETLEFFGLPVGYMQGNGHWDDWLEKEAEKRKQKEKFRKQLGQTSKIRTHRQNKKENEEPVKPSYFDFSPLGKALGLLKDANLTVRSFLRKIIYQNKNLIASFFVNEKGEPSETRCFDVMSLHKKLTKAGIQIPPEFCNKIGPILLCFGELPYTKHVVQRMPEEEVKVQIEKKETKKKKVPKKKEVKEEEEVKQEVKPINVTVYDVSISDFFKAVETSFKYDKLMYEMSQIQDEEFIKEYEAWKKTEDEAYQKSLLVEKSTYEKIVEQNIKKNEKESKKEMENYAQHIEEYTDETSIPPTPNEVLNAFCVKLFFIEQAFESRSSDFLMQAFDLFPDKDYLILTQPHSFIENSLLENFIKIEKKVDSLFGEVLYILPRESLMISLVKVSYATMDELYASSYLFEELAEEGNHIFQLAINAIKNPSSKFMCLVCKINDHIIGVCVLSKEININYYDSHFSLRDYLNLDKISKYFHSRIVFFASHKNFVQYTKVIMKEILRLVNKIALYYEVSPDVTKCPKFLRDLVLSRNRKFPHFIIKKWAFETELYEDEKIKTRLDGEERDELDEMESHFCLNYLSKKTMVESRIANNNRIVVVGASDTGISFIESLLSIRYLEFSYIYLVAPGGLLYHHINEEINNLKVSINNYQIKDLKKLLLEQRIKIINSKVVDIKPKQKYIQFEDLSILNYDYLILTLGLQDRLWKDISNTSCNMIDEIFKGFKEIQDELENKKESAINITQLTNIQTTLKEFVKEMIFSIDDPKIYEKFSITDRKVISLRKNPKFHILLYGRNINLFCFIQGLIKRRVPPSKITLVIPPIRAKKEDKKEEISYDDLVLINGTSMEDCKEVNVFMIEKLKSLGVQVYENLLFGGVNLKRQEFTDPTNIKAELADLVIETFKFFEEGKEHVENLSTNLIVTGGMLDVDPIVFKFIHENGLVYNGRAIINNNFLTADSSIFAAGKLCEFSLCYSTEKSKLLKLECYNSQEVGYTLAKYFLQTIDSQLNVDASAFDDQKLPVFYLPQLIGCYLPGDYIFIKAKSIKETNRNILECPNNRLPLTYNTLSEGGCYLSFIFNTFGIIDTVIYLGRDKVDYRSIVSLVGLHENYLNQLLARFDSKLVENISHFLSENWAMAIFHDKFSQLVIKLKAILHEEDILNIVQDAIEKHITLDRNEIKNLLSKVDKNTQLKIEWEIVNFLSENKNQLPFYHIPQLKEPGQ